MKSEFYNCDNMEFMAKFPDNHFELAIVDPPYGIGFDHKIREKSDKKWDTCIPKDNYFIELCRVSKNQIIWGANYFPSLWKSGCRGFIFWNKDINFETYSAGELAYSSFNTPAKYFYYAWNGLADGVRGRNKKEKSIHPTQKPVRLYEWLLANYAKEGDKILDTHVGSGSSRIACHNLKFDFFGCELDEDYFKQAEQRYQEHIRQETLF